MFKYFENYIQHLFSWNTHYCLAQFAIFASTTRKKHCIDWNHGCPNPSSTTIETDSCDFMLSARIRTSADFDSRINKVFI